MKLSNKITLGTAFIVAGIAATVLTSQSEPVQAQTTWSADNKVDLQSEKAKLGYTIGAQIMTDLARNGLLKEIDIDALVAAQKDVLNNIDLRMSDEEMQQAQQAFSLKLQQEMAELAEKNKAESDAYLVKMKGEDGVQATESGLLYKVEREGKGENPTNENTVKIHYVGTLMDGTKFDSSYDRNQPAEFPVSGVVPGFSEGLKLMNEGSKIKLIIPSELAYGAQAPAAIGPNQTLIFEVELIEIK